MTTLPFTVSPSPATYASPALIAEADHNSSWIWRRTHLIAMVPSGGAGDAETGEAAGSEPAETFSFTSLEIVAIQFGKRDPLPVQETGGRFLRLFRVLFGTRQPNPLADDRLEALRLVVIAMRQRKQSPEAAVEAALAAGIRRSQLDSLAAELRASSA